MSQISKSPRAVEFEEALTKFVCALKDNDPLLMDRDVRWMVHAVLEEVLSDINKSVKDGEGDSEAKGFVRTYLEGGRRR